MGLVSYSVVLRLSTPVTMPMQQFRVVIWLGLFPSSYDGRLKSLLNLGLFSCHNKNTEFIHCQQKTCMLFSSSAQHIPMQPLMTLVQVNIPWMTLHWVTLQKWIATLWLHVCCILESGFCNKSRCSVHSQQVENV